MAYGDRGDRPAEDACARLAAYVRFAGAAGRRGPSPIAEDEGPCVDHCDCSPFADLYDDELDVVVSALDALDDRPSE
jgi:hypothetical protein